MRSKGLKEIHSIYRYEQGDFKTLKAKVYNIGMNKRDLKKLTKAQLINLLLKQEKDSCAQKPSDSSKQMVNDYENVIQPPELFRDGYKPIPPPRNGKWKNGETQTCYTQECQTNG